MSESDYVFGRASGPDSDNCHFLLYRSPKGEPFEPDRGESWIMACDDESVLSLVKHEGWYTALWRSPSGMAWVTEATGNVQRVRLDGDDVHTDTLDASLHGIWGLDDEHVFVWGGVGDEPYLARLRGEDWSRIPLPDARGVAAMCGASERDLWIVGEGGLAAHWDGSVWTVAETPTNEHLLGVCVAPNGEVWACGNGGSVLRGGRDGFETVVAGAGHLQSVASFGDKIWVGAPEALSVVEGDALRPVKEQLRGAQLESGATLVVSCPSRLGHSEDGTKFTWFDAADAGQLCDELEPSWA